MDFYNRSLPNLPRSRSAEYRLAPGPDAPWWSSAKLRWLLAAPAMALVVVTLFGHPLRWALSYGMATWWSDRADAQFVEDNHTAALENLDRAFAWMPREPQLFYLRAQIHTQDQNLYAALADYDAVIEQAPNFAPAYTGRGEVQRRLGMHHEALADLTRAIELGPADDPSPLNHRAYARALAGVELPLALADVQQAIELAGEPHPALLDTRGYLHYLLGDEKKAEADLAQAIEIAEQQTEDVLLSDEFELLPSAAQARYRRLLHENLAVMYHHRGLIHERLGRDRLAQLDQDLADRFGYDPFRGVE